MIHMISKFTGLASHALSFVWLVAAFDFMPDGAFSDTFPGHKIRVRRIAFARRTVLIDIGKHHAVVGRRWLLLHQNAQLRYEDSATAQELSGYVPGLPNRHPKT